MVAIGLMATIFRRVGARRFELLTFCTPSKRATSLRYAPKKVVRNQRGILLNWSKRYHVFGGLSIGIRVPLFLLAIVFECDKFFSLPVYL